MKQIFVLLSLVLFISSCQVASKPSQGLRHVVSFKFTEEATDSQISSLIQDFEGLQNDIPQIKSFEWGLNNSPEGLDQGMSHIFLLTFEDEKGRDEYLPHPAHEAFGEKHGSIIEDVFVVDYTIKL